MAQRGANVSGIDMGEAPLAVARLHQLESNVSVDYRQITAEELAAEQPGRYDVVTCMEMLEHVPDPQSVISACATLCKPGGDMYFSTLNRNPKSYLFAIVGAEFVLKLLPKGTHDYAKFIRPSELATWLRHADLELQDMCGMLYNPLTQTYRLDARDVSVNYLLHAQKSQVNQNTIMQSTTPLKAVLFDLDGNAARHRPRVFTISPAAAGLEQHTTSPRSTTLNFAKAFPMARAAW